LISSCTSITHPQESRGTALSLPFPTADVPIGVSSAEIRISWTDRERVIAAGDSDSLSYSGIFSADYTIRFDGEKPTTVKIAFPMPILGDFRVLSDRVYFESNLEYNVYAYIDGTFIETFHYIINENITRTGAEDLAGQRTPILADFINSVRTLIAEEAPNTNAFESDTAMPLYTFSLFAPYDTEIQAVSLIFRYDPERTMVTYSYDFERIAPHRFQPRVNTGLGMAQIADTLPIYGSGTIEVFVIGEDTLTWEWELLLNEGVDESEFNSLYATFNLLNVTVSHKTPQDYFRQIIIPGFGNGEVYIDPDYLMNWVDWVFASPTHNLNNRWNYIDLNRFERLFMPKEHNVVVAEIPFEPGQERILSISFPIYSGATWNNEMPYSLFHHTILTEAADYWEFFDYLTVITEHPDDIVEYVLYGFEIFENFSTFSTTNIQEVGDNIHIGFLLPDERERTNVWLMLLMIVLLILGVGAGVQLVIALIVVIIVKLVKKIRARKNQT